VDGDTVIVGQTNNNKELYGLGKRTNISENAGYIYEGNFVENELSGFGRTMTHDGYYAIGVFKYGTLYSTRFNSNGQIIDIGMFKDYEMQMRNYNSSIYQNTLST
jgi:hypothetical protein